MGSGTPPAKEGVWGGGCLSQEKMNFVFEMACFGAFTAAFFVFPRQKNVEFSA